MQFEVPENEINNILHLKFRKGVYGTGYYFRYTKDCLLIKQKGQVIFIEGSSTHREEVVEKLSSCALKNNKSWLIVLKENNMVSFVPTDEISSKMLYLIKSINNLTWDLEFEKKIFNGSRVELVFHPETKVIIHGSRGIIQEIKEIEDAVAFNSKQQNLLEEVSQFRVNILSEVKNFDVNAILSKDLKTIQIFNQPFTFLTQKVEDGWKISFFKKYNPNYIYFVNTLSQIESRLMELARKFSKEERFVELLFR